MQTMRVLDERGADRRVVLIGDQAWPMPIPLVRDKGAWRFATEEGADELINRRIGGNERNAITVLRAYVDAQRQYASRDRDGDNVLQYAQKLGSTPGKHDGLYWPADAAKDGEQSPFGPLVAESAAYLKGHKEGDPYRGYHFKILTRQGKSAPGGAYNYVINGRMIAGFAMVAYPAQYGDSGVMTFIVSNNGKIYEKDLGKNSRRRRRCDDDLRSWSRVEGSPGVDRPARRASRRDATRMTTARRALRAAIAQFDAANARRSESRNGRRRRRGRRSSLYAERMTRDARALRSRRLRGAARSPRAASTSSAGRFRAATTR